MYNNVILTNKFLTNLAGVGITQLIVKRTMSKMLGKITLHFKTRDNLIKI